MKNYQLWYNANKVILEVDGFARIKHDDIGDYDKNN